MDPVRRLLTAAGVERQRLPDGSAAGLRLPESQVERPAAVVRKAGARGSDLRPCSGDTREHEGQEQTQGGNAYRDDHRSSATIEWSCSAS
jgi:hypothetical protein